MKFSERTKREARLRQNGRCAACGENLDDLWEEAHHIYPHSYGGADRADNCVILCDDCHSHVHYDGRFRSRLVAPSSYFRFFKG